MNNLLSKFVGKADDLQNQAAIKEAEAQKQLKEIGSGAASYDEAIAQGIVSALPLLLGAFGNNSDKVAAGSASLAANKTYGDIAGKIRDNERQNKLYLYQNTQKTADRLAQRASEKSDFADRAELRGEETEQQQDFQKEQQDQRIKAQKEIANARMAQQRQLAQLKMDQSLYGAITDPGVLDKKAIIAKQFGAESVADLFNYYAQQLRNGSMKQVQVSDMNKSIDAAVSLYGQNQTNKRHSSRIEITKGKEELKEDIINRRAQIGPFQATKGFVDDSKTVRDFKQSMGETITALNAVQRFRDVKNKFGTWELFSREGKAALDVERKQLLLETAGTSFARLSEKEREFLEEMLPKVNTPGALIQFNSSVESRLSAFENRLLDRLIGRGKGAQVKMPKNRNSVKGLLLNYEPSDEDYRLDIDKRLPSFDEEQDPIEAAKDKNGILTLPDGTKVRELEDGSFQVLEN